MVLARPGGVWRGSAGLGPVRYGLTTASSIACGVWGCGKHHFARWGKARRGGAGNGMARHGPITADKGNLLVAFFLLE